MPWWGYAVITGGSTLSLLGTIAGLFVMRGVFVVRGLAEWMGK